MGQNTGKLLRLRTLNHEALPSGACARTSASGSELHAIWTARWSGGISNPIEVIEHRAFRGEL